MFEDLAVHSKIVVTGSQRSGTTIAGRMIAHDTGHMYVDESTFRDNHRATWRNLITLNDDIVVQCPCLLKTIVDDPPRDIFVVLMRRSLDDIHKSIDRIGWTGSPQEMRHFALGPDSTPKDLPKAKYEYWDAMPKSVPFLEVDYESLREHPFFVADEQRVNFGAKQTRLSWSEYGPF